LFRVINPFVFSSASVDIGPPPHQDKYLAMWLPDMDHLTLSGSTVTAWTDSIGGVAMAGSGTASVFDTDHVYVSNGNLNIPSSSDWVDADNVFLAVQLVSDFAFATVFASDSSAKSFRRNTLGSLTYRATPTTNADDYTHSGGRVWINDVLTSTFGSLTERHVVQAEQGTGGLKFAGFRPISGRPTFSNYYGIICTEALTTGEASAISAWLQAYSGV